MLRVRDRLRILGCFLLAPQDQLTKELYHPIQKALGLSSLILLRESLLREVIRPLLHHFRLGRRQVKRDVYDQHDQILVKACLLLLTLHFLQSCYDETAHVRAEVIICLSPSLLFPCVCIRDHLLDEVGIKGHQVEKHDGQLLMELNPVV